VLVVLHQEPNGDHEIVDVVEDQCPLLGIRLLLVEEGLRMVTPVAERVEVMGGMVPIVKAVTVTLSLDC
jgi:hypothetical protein